jgi:hypothetical protein
MRRQKVELGAPEMAGILGVRKLERQKCKEEL